MFYVAARRAGAWMLVPEGETSCFTTAITIANKTRNEAKPKGLSVEIWDDQGVVHWRDGFHCQSPKDRPGPRVITVRLSAARYRQAAAAALAQDMSLNQFCVDSIVGSIEWQQLRLKSQESESA